MIRLILQDNEGRKIMDDDISDYDLSFPKGQDRGRVLEALEKGLEIARTSSRVAEDILTKLIVLANALDQEGLTEEADEIDKIIEASRVHRRPEESLNAKEIREVLKDLGMEEAEIEEKMHGVSEEKKEEVEK